MLVHLVKIISQELFKEFSSGRHINDWKPLKTHLWALACSDRLFFCRFVQACNSDQYVAVPRKDMARMLQQKGQSNHTVLFLWNLRDTVQNTQLNSLHFDFSTIKSWHFSVLFSGFLQGHDDTDYAQEQDEEMGPGVTTDLPRYALQCQWAPLSGLDPDTLTFPGGAPIQLHTVPPSLLLRIPHFYVCTRCGKVFWEGSHFGRVMSMFQEVLHVTHAESAADWPLKIFGLEPSNTARN